MKISCKCYQNWIADVLCLNRFVFIRVCIIDNQRNNNKLNWLIIIVDQEEEIESNKMLIMILVW